MVSRYLIDSDSEAARIASNDESIPEDRHTPSGTSQLRCKSTDSLKVSSSLIIYSSYESSLLSAISFGLKFCVSTLPSWASNSRIVEGGSSLIFS